VCVILDRVSHWIGGGHGHSHGHPDDPVEHDASQHSHHHHHPQQQDGPHDHGLEMQGHARGRVDGVRPAQGDTDPPELSEIDNTVKVEASGPDGDLADRPVTLDLTALRESPRLETYHRAKGADASNNAAAHFAAKQASSPSERCAVRSDAADDEDPLPSMSSDDDPAILRDARPHRHQNDDSVVSSTVSNALHRPQHESSHPDKAGSPSADRHNEAKHWHLSLPPREINQVMERYTEAETEERHDREERLHQAASEAPTRAQEPSESGVQDGPRLVTSQSSETLLPIHSSSTTVEASPEHNGHSRSAVLRLRVASAHSKELENGSAVTLDVLNAPSTKAPGSAHGDAGVVDAAAARSIGAEAGSSHAAGAPSGPAEQRHADLIRTGLMTGLAVGLHNFPGKHTAVKCSQQWPVVRVPAFILKWVSDAIC